MATYGSISESETEPIVKVTRNSGEKSDADAKRPGYESRRRVNNAGTFVFSDHGTFLAISTEGDSVVSMDNPTSVALKLCEEQVVKPFSRLLLFVGWLPVFEQADNLWKRVINILYPVIMCVLILFGYIIQYAACFRRDRAGNGIATPELPIFPVNWSNGTVQPGSDWPPCQQFIISQYLIPDTLHSIAYAYSFYTLRISQSEQLPTLMERVFLQASPTPTGFRSQGKLIRKLRMLLYGSILWVTLSQVAQIIHIISEYDNMDFYWLEPSTEGGRIMLLIMLVISFVALDVVYAAVVMNYCVQCFLLVFYIKRIQEKIREKFFDLLQSMKEIAEIVGHMRVLNNNPGIALSLVMINFGTMAALGALALVNPQDGQFTTLMYVATAMAVILWIILMLLPIFAAAVLTSRCNSLRKIGHEIRGRPFGYENDSDEQLNSFLIYMSTLTMAAKIFLIPVMTSRICTVSLIVGMTLLLLFQTGVLHVWL